MPEFAANLSLLFTEYDLTDRFRAAASSGFRSAELLFPYELPIETLKHALNSAGMSLTLINTPAGDWAAGERGFAALPGQETTFKRGFETALDYALTLNATHIHVMAGVTDSPEAEETFIRNLTWAAAQAPGQSLTIEPINPHDMPGYALDDFDHAARILDRIGAPNLHLQFDAYHAHRITGDLMGCWAQYGGRAAHIQIAGHPGRHEPVDGEINYPAFIRAVTTSGYKGAISAEYFPATNTRAGLGWLEAWRPLLTP